MPFVGCVVWIVFNPDEFWHRGVSSLLGMIIWIGIFGVIIAEIDEQTLRRQNQEKSIRTW